MMNLDEAILLDIKIVHKKFTKYLHKKGLDKLYLNSKVTINNQ